MRQKLLLNSVLCINKVDASPSLHRRCHLRWPRRQSWWILHQRSRWSPSVTDSKNYLFYIVYFCCFWCVLHQLRLYFCRFYVVKASFTSWNLRKSWCVPSFYYVKAIPVCVEDFNSKASSQIFIFAAVLIIPSQRY
jgi:hypothetical protein